MTIEEAIATLKQDLDGRLICYPAELKKAKGLGIEAMKRLQDNRRDPEFDHWMPLPGETQDGTDASVPLLR